MPAHSRAAQRKTTTHAAALSRQLYTAHYWRPRHTAGLGDWAAAVAYADRDTAAGGAPVLLRSQYIESDEMPWAPLADNPMFSQLNASPSKSRLTGLG